MSSKCIRLVRIRIPRVLSLFPFSIFPSTCKSTKLASRLCFKKQSDNRLKAGYAKFGQLSYDNTSLCWVQRYDTSLAIARPGIPAWRSLAWRSPAQAIARPGDRPAWRSPVRAYRPGDGTTWRSPRRASPGRAIAWQGDRSARRLSAGIPGRAIARLVSYLCTQQQEVLSHDSYRFALFPNTGQCNTGECGGATKSCMARLTCSSLMHVSICAAEQFCFPRRQCTPRA
jgi:hypothetical protein